MAAVATSFRLPGVYFLSAPPPAPPALPPLDVAAFVGFATRGPLDQPVPVADLAQFDAVFGGPLALARDADGTLIYANLRDAVAGFFAAGGVRCYVVRVAGAAASAARLAVPGMVAIDALGNVGRAELYAASAGAWGNTLSLGAILTTSPLPASAFAMVDGQTLSWTTTGAPNAVQLGDVLRLGIAEGSLGTVSQWLFPVGAIGATTLEEATTMLAADRVWRLRTGIGASPPAIVAVSRLALAGASPLSVAAAFSPATSGIALMLGGADALAVRRDNLLLLDLADGSRHLLTVADAEAAPPGSLPTPQAIIAATEMLSLSEKGLVLPTAGTLVTVELMQANLRLVYGEIGSCDIDAVGFNDGHPRFWGDIAVAESGAAGTTGAAVTSSSGTALDPGEATQFYDDLFGAARADLDWTDTRLPIIAAAVLAPGKAALDPAALALGASVTYLPVGMPAIGSNADLVGPDDGMEGADDLATYDAARFLDAALLPEVPGGSLATLPAAQIAVPASELLADATDRYFLQNIRLKGIHSLMFVDEIALISVPDALQLGWAAGAIQPVSTPPAPATPAPPVAGFADCALAQTPVVLAVDPSGGPVTPPPGQPPLLVTITGSGFSAADLPSVSFGGVLATSVRVTSSTTLTCDAPQARAPGLVSVTITNNAGSASLAAGFFYWVPSTAPPLPVGTPVESYDAGTLQRIHVALVGLCQARADAVAVLALPFHFAKPDCLGWLQTLRANLHLPRHGASFSGAQELADLSYAAVYHPWLLIPDSAGAVTPLQPIPPDGAMCGVIAAQELARQVWVAPANVPLPGVLDLQPALSDDDWAELFALGFNLVRAEANDFRIMGAHTLADDASLLQLSVRRLLIQLRKAALILGEDYVFAKNDDALRQRVRHGLEDLLGLMFSGGAFAGATQQSSYQIAVDDSVNTPDDIDQGRIIAQILVAPSQPMEFLTVLLTRNGDGGLQAAEA